VGILHKTQAFNTKLRVIVFLIKDLLTTPEIVSLFQPEGLTHHKSGHRPVDELYSRILIISLKG
jgi:hypothetical protein